MLQGLGNAPYQRIARHTRRAVATDRNIDALAYELYGLTAEEIKIVES